MLGSLVNVLTAMSQLMSSYTIIILVEVRGWWFKPIRSSTFLGLENLRDHSVEVYQPASVTVVFADYEYPE